MTATTMDAAPVEQAYAADAQARLDGELAADPRLTPEFEPPTLQERFDAFHADNPWVYDRLRSLALDMVDKGHQHIGIGMLWEVLRWQTLTAAKVAVGHGQPKLNNDYRSRYARLLMEREPRLANVFETRGLRA